VTSCVFIKLPLKSNEQEFSLGGVKELKKLQSFRTSQMKNILKVNNARVKDRGMEREEELIIICVQVMYVMKSRGPRTERCHGGHHKMKYTGKTVHSDVVGVNVHCLSASSNCCGAKSSRGLEVDMGVNP